VLFLPKNKQKQEQSQNKNGAINKAKAMIKAYFAESEPGHG
jgi:hypothetical protein